MSFTVGLAIFASALATGLGSYIRAAATEERSIREDMVLESAAAAVLGRLAAGDTVATAGKSENGGRTIEVAVSPTSLRIDLATDDAETIRIAGVKAGFRIDPNTARASEGLAVLSAQMRLGPSAEDCLRRSFTYGRGGQPKSGAAASPATIRVQPGDQVDVRISTSSAPATVLWVRARFTDDETGWALHDYRRLRGVTPCAD